MSNPGSELRRELRRLLPSLNAVQLSGFSYVICQRLEPLCVQFFDNGDLHRAICELLKTAALGDTVDMTRAEALRARAECVIAELQDSDDTDYPLEVVNALAAALQRHAPRSWDALDQIFLAAQDPAATTQLPSIDAVIEEEAQAQLRLFNAIAQSPAPTAIDLDLLASEPMWVARFKAAQLCEPSPRSGCRQKKNGSGCPKPFPPPEFL